MSGIGKLGRSEVSRHDLRTLWFDRYASDGLVGYTYPPPGDDWTGVEGTYTWLGNDRVGCCTRTVIGHMFQQRCAILGIPCSLTTDDILKAYKDGIGWDGVPGSPSDRGDQIINALVQAKNVGYRNGEFKIDQFGRVNHKDPLAMRAALHLTGSLIIGASLPKSIWTQGNEWSTPPVGERHPEDAPGSAGGHAFLITGHERDKWFAMPWITKKKIRYSWEDLNVDEAWFVIDKRWIEKNRKAPNGFDLARLQHDAAAIAGS